MSRIAQRSANGGRVAAPADLGTFDSATAASSAAHWIVTRESGARYDQDLDCVRDNRRKTARIADQLAEVIRSRGLEADAFNLKPSSGVSVDGYDAVVVGGSIHMGKHQEDVVEFVGKNRSELDRLPSAFFSVSLAANGDLANAEAYVENFAQQAGWRPTKVGLFSGALLYRQYGFIKRYMMKRIVRDKPGMSTDTSRDYVYTDWDQVRRFAEDFVERLVPEGTTKITS
jgi:menaquinone-dependent protoporphyrinogen oxidase